MRQILDVHFNVGAYVLPVVMLAKHLLGVLINRFRDISLHVFKHV